MNPQTPKEQAFLLNLSKVLNAISNKDPNADNLKSSLVEQLICLVKLPNAKLSELAQKRVSTLVSVPTKNQKFSSQKGGQRRTSLATFRNVLDRVSGGDQPALLGAYFESPEGKGMKVAFPRESSSSKEIIQRIRSMHAAAGPHEKAQWLSLVSCLTGFHPLSPFFPPPVISRSNIPPLLFP